MTNIRKRVAWILLVAMCLWSLSACHDGGAATSTTTPTTAATVAVPSLTDCRTVEGMLSHTDRHTYDFYDAEGIVSTEELLFVPAGTVLNSACNMAVYAYDSDMDVDVDTTVEMGQSTITQFIVMMQPGERVVPKDCYIRVTVNGTLSDVSVTFPTERRGEVRIYDPEKEAYQNRVDRVSALIGSAQSDAVNYLFLTDLHNDNGISAAQTASVKKQVTLAVELANSNESIDFVVIGGDTTSGHYANKNTAFRYANAVLEPLKQCKKPVLVLMGNHDDNSYSSSEKLFVQADADNLISKQEWNEKILKVYSPQAIVHDSQNADSAYYYYDLPDKKTRMICLDALDYAQETDENGTILASSLASNSKGNSCVGRTYWGYSARQIQWLANEALTADEGWNYVFLSHMDARSSYAYGDELLQVMTAFKSRSVYTADGIGTRDFTAATGDILVYHHGHGHTELVKEMGDGVTWLIETSTANISLLSGNTKGSENYRAFDTSRECCFDVISVTETAINKYAFGAGKDAELAQP